MNKIVVAKRLNRFLYLIQLYTTGIRGAKFHSVGSPKNSSQPTQARFESASLSTRELKRTALQLSWESPYNRLNHQAIPPLMKLTPVTRRERCAGTAKVFLLYPSRLDQILHYYCIEVWLNIFFPDYNLILLNRSY